jgi:hypothetical protein
MKNTIHAMNRTQKRSKLPLKQTASNKSDRAVVKLAGVKVTVRICIQEVLFSNLGSSNGYRD